MYVTQSIQRPTGINVFGSYVVRVEPDVALVSFGVSRIESEPSAAFAATREGVAAVRDYLREAGVAPADVTTSQIQLVLEKSGYGKEQVVHGYRAKVQFAVRLVAIDRFEELVAGVVGAGANAVDHAALKTTRLAELRATARKEAFAAARRKAQLYAEAAGVNVGHVVHIEDVDPDALASRRGHGADLELESDEAEVQPHAPGTIEVAAAVVVAFAIERTKAPTGFA